MSVSIILTLTGDLDQSSPGGHFGRDLQLCYAHRLIILGINPNMSTNHSQRKIIHIDMDCFYAAIEMRDNPTLKNHPIAVGGDPKRRGVITTCNYHARTFGVHSAMASAYALRLCPMLKIIPVNMEKYKAQSLVIRDILTEYSDIIEPLSLDEAYLDVTGSSLLNGSATLIAQEIRTVIHEQTQLTASAGIAPNKCLAKIASDWHKPNGQFVITPDDIAPFMQHLSVRKIPGVGKVTEKKLLNLSISTCGQLQCLSVEKLIGHFGIFGKRLFELCRGHDERQLETERQRKSLSVEETYTHDLENASSCIDKLLKLMDKFTFRLKKITGGKSIHKQFVKMKFCDFSQTTVERVSSSADITIFKTLVEEAYQRKAMPVRLLGIGVRFSETENAQQLCFLEFLESTI